MSVDRSLRWRIAVTLIVVGGAVVSGCAAPAIADDLPTRQRTSASATGDEEDGTPSDVVLSDPTHAPDLEGKAPDARCTDECATDGAKRCSSTSLSGTEVCKMGEGGCRTWTPGVDCEADYSCDKTKNDGTCQAGCTNDEGCSAANAGVAQCTEDGTTELTCTKVGACYVFKTTRSDIAQDCVSPTYCGAASGRRISCMASAAGACTQHVAVYNDCPSGSTCTGSGVCTTTTTTTPPPPPPPAPTGGCYSNTLGKTVVEGACVYSAGDGVVEQCHDSKWYRGVVGNVGPYGACK